MNNVQLMLFINLPAHSSPDPVKPFLQLHERESEWLIQVALG